MSMRISTLVSAMLLGGMLFAGSMMSAQAGDGCPTKGKDKDTDGSTSAAYPMVILQS